jgi:hypothetical protein
MPGEKYFTPCPTSDKFLSYLYVFESRKQNETPILKTNNKVEAQATPVPNTSLLILDGVGNNVPFLTPPL